MTGLHYDAGADAVSRIAAAGMDAIEARAERERVTLGTTVVSVVVDGQPEGESDASLYVHFEADDEPDQVTVLATLCARAQAIAEQEGIELDMIVNGHRA